MDHIAVLDIGKTNIKLSIALSDGTIVETVSAANETLPSPPYRHPDADGIEDWFLDQLRLLIQRYRVTAVVTTAHGSLGALVGEDRLLMPLIDYENEPPAELDRNYGGLVSSAQERGSPIMPGLAHLARQLYFLETEWPDVVARAQHFLGGPQYMAWRLSGVAATERTYLGAQSHLWDARGNCYLPIVESRGWRRLLPPLVPAWGNLGPLRPELRRRHGLPEGISVLCGIHDSSANFYRFQQAGLNDVALCSTGTWIVGLGDIKRPAEFSVSEQRHCNCDVHGNPLAGVLAMGGREFAVLSDDAASHRSDLRDVAHVLQLGTMALPSFSSHDAMFPGTAGKGRIVGPALETPGLRRALALVYVALLTNACLDTLGDNATTVLDGTFVTDPVYPALVAALRPGKRTLFNADAYGTAGGAALLAQHSVRTGPVSVDVRRPEDINLPEFASYAARWRQMANDLNNLSKETSV